MDITKYLKPIIPSELGYYHSDTNMVMGDIIRAYTPDDGLPTLARNALVLLGVGEDRGCVGNAGCALAPDEIRRYLYNLAPPTEENVTVLDYGNVIPGQTIEDTYYAVSDIVASVVGQGGTIVLLGGSQDITFAAYKGFANLHRQVNTVAIDPRFDLDNSDELNARSWLRYLIMEELNYLFIHSTVGFQTYFVGQHFIRLMDQLKFDAFSLSEIQADMNRAEAQMRNSDIVSVDISAVRQSDAPGCGTPSPHGFYGEEFCRIMRFAGMSDKVSCLGLFDVNPTLDRGGQTAHMAAQGVWFFTEGFFNRLNEDPKAHPEQCKRFIVQLEEEGTAITFYKSKLSDRWWMEVPCNDEEKRDLYSEQFVLPCTYGDYKQALGNEIPNLWWTYYQRLNTPL